MRPLPDTPPGWSALDNTLVPTKTLAGYMARGEELEGGCRAHGCYRKGWIDPHRRVEAMLANASLNTLEKMFQCNRPDGCYFHFFGPRADQSVKLLDLRAKSHVRIRMRCDACKWFRLRKVEWMLEVLEVLKPGGSNCRVGEIGARIRGACPACKETKWAASVVWLRTDTANWHAKGEKLFEEIGPE